MLVNWKCKMPDMVNATEVVLPLASFHGPVGVMALFSPTFRAATELSYKDCPVFVAPLHQICSSGRYFLAGWQLHIKGWLGGSWRVIKYQHINCNNMIYSLAPLEGKWLCWSICLTTVMLSIFITTLLSPSVLISSKMKHQCICSAIYKLSAHYVAAANAKVTT